MVLFQYAGIVEPEKATKKLFEYFQKKTSLEAEISSALYAYTSMFVECDHDLVLSTSDVLGLTIHEKKALRDCKLHILKHKHALISMVSDPASRQAVIDPDSVVREKIKSVLKDSVARLAKEKYFNG
jgi:hypothetical protein